MEFDTFAGLAKYTGISPSAAFTLAPPADSPSVLVLIASAQTGPAASV